MELRPYAMGRTGTYEKLEELAKAIKANQSYFAEINEDEIPFFTRMMQQYYDLQVIGQGENGKVLFNKLTQVV